jgi:hypothetical protein
MTQIEVIQKNPSEFGEQISQDLGIKFVNEFQQRFPNEIPHFTIGKNILSQLLAQPLCVGIRFYNSINEFGHKTLVYVGVDANNKAILEISSVDNAGKLQVNPAIVADRAIPGIGRPSDSIDTSEFDWTTMI